MRLPGSQILHLHIKRRFSEMLPPPAKSKVFLGELFLLSRFYFTK